MLEHLKLMQICFHRILFAWSLASSDERRMTSSWKNMLPGRVNGELFGIDARGEVCQRRYVQPEELPAKAEACLSQKIIPM